MAAAGRPTASDTAPDEAAAQLRAAPFVRVSGVATGAGLAATGQLARALAAADIPFQAAVGQLGDAGLAAAPDADGETVSVAIGRPDVAADVTVGHPTGRRLAATDVAAALDAADDEEDGGRRAALLALAELVAGDREDPERRAELTDAAGLDRRSGLGLPVPDAADGLAHSTLVHTAVSGEPGAAAERLGIDTDGPAADGEPGREHASVAAVSVAAEDRPPAAGDAVGRVLRPVVGGPFETVPGFADVLGALAARAPGRGLQVAMQGEAIADETAADALATWRAHGEAVHATVRAAEPARYDGLIVTEAGRDGPTWAVARLLRDFASPEPVVVLVGESTAIATTRGDPDPFGTAVEAAAAEVEGTVVVAGTRARASVTEPGAFADALQEAI